MTIRRYFQTGPEIIRLAVMMHVSVLLSYRNDLFQRTAQKVLQSRRSVRLRYATKLRPFRPLRTLQLTGAKGYDFDASSLRLAGSFAKL